MACDPPQEPAELGSTALPREVCEGRHIPAPEPRLSEEAESCPRALSEGGGASRPHSPV